jgi:hypothetical protein
MAIATPIATAPSDERLVFCKENAALRLFS